MQCKSCGYGLWNLRSRRCPECGTDFTPSEFDFARNSVKYCCPHCTQEYYGTDERGHLTPRAFDCVKCGKHIHMDECVLLPAAGVTERETGAERNPWLETRRGVFGRYFSTIGHALVLPHRLGRATPESSSLGRASLFAAITHLLAVVGFTAPILLMVGVGALLPAYGSGSGRSIAAGLATGVGITGGFMLGAAIVLLLLTYLYGLLAHLLLRVTGGAPKPLRSTMHAVLYGAGANAASAVPCFGFYFGWIWWMVSATVAIAYAHGVKGWRAAVAGVVPPLLAMGLLIGGYAAMIWGVTSMASAGMAGMGGGPYGAAGIAGAASSTQQVLLAVEEVVDDRLQAGLPGGLLPPEHALFLIAHGPLSGYEFVLSDTMTGMHDVPVAGGHTLLSVQTEPPHVQQQIARQAAQTLPAGVVAHRFGDFVFTHHGMDLTAGMATGGPEDDLWVVIASPDPDVTGNSQYIHDWNTNSQLLIVGTRGGTTETIDSSAFPGRLSQQNQLRAQFGLPPLPSPETVKHANPAVQGAATP